MNCMNLVDINWDLSKLEKDLLSLKEVRNVKYKFCQERLVWSFDSIITEKVMEYRNKVIRIQQGVYSGLLNFDHFIDEYALKYRTLTYEEQEDKDFPIWESFGVCDNVEQALGYGNCNLPADISLVLRLWEVLKSEQPSEWGWRWHKWGSYIGDQKPTCEYIYDEPEIEKVYCFEFESLKLRIPDEDAPSIGVRALFG